MALLRKTTMVSTVIAAAVIGFALPAAAFQEQRQGGAAVGAAPAAAPQPGFIAPTAGGDAKASGGGTEVRVPGLGKLGSLPKLDFGLELLYGAAEDKPVAVEPHGARTETRDDDLTIRGTVRHKF